MTTLGDGRNDNARDGKNDSAGRAGLTAGDTERFYWRLHRRNFLRVGALGLGTVASLAGVGGQLPKPPVAKSVPHASEVNGHKMVDNIFGCGTSRIRRVRLSGGGECLYRCGDKPTEAFQKSFMTNVGAD